MSIGNHELVADELKDLEKQWNRVEEYCKDAQWSPGITRAVTAAELAITIAIKLEANEKPIKYANGINGKIKDNLLPFFESNSVKAKTVKSLQKTLRAPVKIRNEIVHEGAFASEEDTEAQEAINIIKECINSFLKLYEIQFHL